MERRLAAILAADVVGYSRLMGEDEAGTLASLKEHQVQLIDPAIAKHRGRIFKLMGDGVLAEFGSAVDAVECAVKIQQDMAKRNAGAPEGKRFDFRIGINLGDVIIDGDDIHGDGVNVAARLEGLADPGGVCISGAVFDQVKGKVKAQFEDVGTKKLKNIAERTQVFQVWPPARGGGEEPAERLGVESDAMEGHPLFKWIGFASASVIIIGIALVVLVYLSK